MGAAYVFNGCFLCSLSEAERVEFKFYDLMEDIFRNNFSSKASGTSDQEPNNGIKQGINSRPFKCKCKTLFNINHNPFHEFQDIVLV